MQTITITKTKTKGSPRTQWNIELEGVPFGAIWTYKARGEVHPYHAKPLNGDHKLFDTFEEAEFYMRGEM